MNRYAAVLVFCLSLVVCQAGYAQTIYLWNTSSGAWNNSNHWLPVGVPGPDDQVTIGNGANVNLDGNVHVARLNYQGEVNNTVIRNGSITITEELLWSGGRFASSCTAAIDSLCIAVISDTVRNSGTLINYGKLNWIGGMIEAAGAGLFYNYGEINEQLSGDNRFVYNTGDYPQFFNYGTINKKSGFAISTPLSMYFYNHGTINVEGGQMEILGSGSDSGAYNISANATLRLIARGNTSIAGNRHLRGPVTGEGNVVLGGSYWDGSRLYVRNTFDIKGRTEFYGGEINFMETADPVDFGRRESLCWSAARLTFSTGKRIFIDSLVIRGSTGNLRTIVTGTDTLEINKYLRWEGGRIWPRVSGSGAVVIGPDAFMLLDSANWERRVERPIINYGTILRQRGRVVFWDGSNLQNYGTFLDAPLNRTTFGNFGGWAGPFRNYGIYHKTGIDSCASGLEFINEAGGIVSGEDGVVTMGRGFRNIGSFLPGDSVGVFHLDSELTTAEGSVINIELGGYETGISCDLLEVSGTARLSDTLRISLVDGFVPVVGDTFRVINYAENIGEFDSIFAPVGLTFQPNYQSDHLYLTLTSLVSIDDRQPGNNALPVEFNVAQNYPNPFNPQTTIEFELPAAAVVTLDIYDVLGRRVDTPYRASLPGGRHKYVWNATDAAGNPVAGGFYFYRLQAGKFSATRRMLLVR